MRATKSNELFINMKNVPTYDPHKHYYEQDKKVLDFYQEERRKITEGITVGGYHIHPWLYWHLNYFQTPIPQDKGEDDLVTQPPLDDNMFLITETYKEAEETNNGIGIFGARGVAKALKNDEPILYSDKTWRPIGEAKVGDKIFGADGKTCTIENVSPQGIVDLYKVTLRDGRSVICCDEHLWEVYDSQARTYKTLPLKEIKKRYKYERTYTGSKYKDGKGRVAEVYNYYVPTNDCMEFSEEELPIDPYFIGLWLGDGDSAGPCITTIEPEVVKYIEGFAKSLGLAVTKRGDISYRLVRKTGTKEGNPLKSTMRDLNLIHNKHIPDIYLKGSRDQRLELLKGLMDSDGTASHSNNGSSSVSFTQANLDFCKQVRELCLSLGINCRIFDSDPQYIKKDGTKSVAWHVSIYTRENVFNLSRKSLKINQSADKGKVFRENHSAIVDISPEGNGEATCIRVDNSDKLFVTRDYVVTHNSTFLASLVTWTATTKANGTTSIMGGNDADLMSISNLMKTAFSSVHKAFYIPKTIQDWESHVELGIRQKNNEKLIHHHIAITNANKGGEKESEKGAGLSPKGFVADEIGKWNPKGILNSAIPSFMTPRGARLVHTVAGTGGNQELSKDAKDILENPREYRLLPMDFKRLERGVPKEYITWQDSYKDKFCTFMPGQMSYRLESLKVQSNLAEYLNIDSKDLGKIKINVTDWKDAKEKIDTELASKKKEDSKNKVKMYYPTKIAHCFLVNSVNPFPKAIIDRRIKELEESGDIGKDVELWKDGSKTKYSLVNKKRAEVSHQGGVADAPIILFGELPETPPEKYINVSGHDGYKLDVSETDSLGTFYVLRRRNLEPNTPMEKILCSYSARPENMLDFLNNGEAIVKAFNATCCIEAVDIAFKHHLQRKNEDHKYLAPAFTFAENSKVRGYGLWPSEGNNIHRFNLLVSAMREEHTIGVDDDGNPIIKYGVEFVDDIDLLKEMSDYKKGKNVDRITGYSHALVLARKYDEENLIPKKPQKKQSREQIKKRERLTRNSRYGTGKLSRY